jgi:hypothetical protein
MESESEGEDLREFLDNEAMESESEGEKIEGDSECK